MGAELEIRRMLHDNARRYEWAHKRGDERAKARYRRHRRTLMQILYFMSQRE